MTDWIVVASAARARIFERDGPRSDLIEIEGLANTEERLHGHEIDSDRPGRSFDSMGEHRHAMEPPVGAKEKLAMDFARTVVGTLEAGRTTNRFDQLWVVAPPRFLGRLRGEMGDALSRMVSQEIHKDLTQEDPETVAGQLAAARGE
jgi:protein required for attachment to host cells